MIGESRWTAIWPMRLGNSAGPLRADSQMCRRIHAGQMIERVEARIAGADDQHFFAGIGLGVAEIGRMDDPARRRPSCLSMAGMKGCLVAPGGDDDMARQARARRWSRTAQWSPLKSISSTATPNSTGSRFASRKSFIWRMTTLLCGKAGVPAG